MLPVKDFSDKKIVYVRYANDFLIVVNSTKEDCQKIKSLLKDFLTDHLRLELSDEKTKIMHSSKRVCFLAWDTARDFLDSKRQADSTLSEEDGKTYDAMEQQIVDLGKEIDRLERQEKLAREMSATTTTPVVTTRGSGSAVYWTCE